jgi:S1-C subfamily serine protease
MSRPAACKRARAPHAFLLFTLLVGALMLAPSARAVSAEAPAKPLEVPKVEADTSPAGEDGIDPDRLYAALVRIQTVAGADARSSATLGREREGTGTVIAKGGVVLTIGYLLLEADEIRVTDRRGHVYPARVLAYDHPTGLGLLKITVPVNIEPVRMGTSAKLADREPVLIAGWGGIPDTALAYVVSRRPFSASWEYLLDEAIFTAPPTTGWSGAALVDRKGTIVGVGSLVVRDATEGDPTLPGNMFVPIDALKPILDDMIRTGRRKDAPRPWLGVAADEVQGRLIVSRVSPESPAERAGLRNGDIILGVAGEAVSSQSDFYRKVWSKGKAGAEIPLRVLQGMDVRELSVRSIDRVEYYRSQKPDARSR